MSEDAVDFLASALGALSLGPKSGQVGNSSGSSNSGSTWTTIPAQGLAEKATNLLQGELPTFQPHELQQARCHFENALAPLSGQYGVVLRGSQYDFEGVLKRSKAGHEGAFGDSTLKIAVEAKRSLKAQRLDTADARVRLGLSCLTFPCAFGILETPSPLIAIRWQPEAQGVNLPMFVSRGVLNVRGAQALLMDVGCALWTICKAGLLPWDCHGSDVIVEGLSADDPNQCRATLVDTWGAVGSPCVPTFMPPEHRVKIWSVQESEDNIAQFGQYVFGVFLMGFFHVLSDTPGPCDFRQGYLILTGRASAEGDYATPTPVNQFLQGIALLLLDAQASLESAFEWLFDYEFPAVTHRNVDAGSRLRRLSRPLPVQPRPELRAQAIGDVHFAGLSLSYAEWPDDPEVATPFRKGEKVYSVEAWFAADMDASTPDLVISACESINQAIFGVSNKIFGMLDGFCCCGPRPKQVVTGSLAFPVNITMKEAGGFATAFCKIQEKLNKGWQTVRILAATPVGRGRSWAELGLRRCRSQHAELMFCEDRPVPENLRQIAKDYAERVKNRESQITPTSKSSSASRRNLQSFNATRSEDYEKTRRNCLDLIIKRLAELPENTPPLSRQGLGKLISYEGNSNQKKGPFHDALLQLASDHPMLLDKLDRQLAASLRMKHTPPTEVSPGVGSKKQREVPSEAPLSPTIVKRLQEKTANITDSK
eukprot:TRINITY_DN36703_c0_g1_i2.p1 TRINITY_DN36703_c0_g1~~TRINITY_DN36703_c0_g1_i2.p1  ORF type:complete len:709 (-),score=102.47 TRINITY_DN36703_c0_g1_i2:178-2304(-)